MTENKDITFNTACSNTSNRTEDEDSDEWDEMETNGEQTTCLFCPNQFLTIAVALDHCRTEHNFDLLELKNKFNMDCYSYIKMINFIRKHKPNPRELIESSPALWNDDIYLKPGDMESWLMYDFDDLGSAPSTPHYAIDGKTPISNINYSDLKRQIHDLTIQLRDKDVILQNALADMSKMKEVTRKIVESGDTQINNSIPVTTGSLPLGCDGDYFNSYSHFGIHYEMLSDSVRTESYQNAILNNPELFLNKRCLDVGCGTGILSMFAAKAGASVIGIDQSEVIYRAMGIVRENNLQDRINLIKGRLEDVDPFEKVDVIVSEWMGYFLLFEGMLDCFIYARDKYLKPGGEVLPNRCTLSITGCSDIDRYQKWINYWDDVYGFTMKSMKNDVLREAFVETVPEEAIVTNSAVLTAIDLKNCTTDTCEFESKFTLNVTKTGPLTSLVGFFDIFFDLKNSVNFTTGPHGKKTHWQQTVFYLKEPINVSEGDTIEGSLKCSRLKKYVRGLRVIIKLGQDEYEYVLD